MKRKITGSTSLDDKLKEHLSDSLIRIILHIFLSHIDKFNNNQNGRFIEINRFTTLLHFPLNQAAVYFYRADSVLSMIRKPRCLLPGLAITNKKLSKEDVYRYAPPWPTGISHSAANCALISQSRGLYCTLITANHFIYSVIYVKTFLLYLAKNAYPKLACEKINKLTIYNKPIPGV